MNCYKCNQEVEWRESKAGNRYLAVRAEIRGDSGRVIKVVYPAHQCKATPEEIEANHARRVQEIADRLAAGEIMKDQIVIVHKGRKLPIGTIARVFWVASGPDMYGVTKVGLITEGEVKTYVNIQNVKAHDGMLEDGGL